MMPSLSFYLIVHLIVIGTKSLFQTLRHRLVPVLIVFGVVSLLSTAVVATVGGALGQGTNLSWYRNYTYQCVPPVQQYKDKKVIVRVDDIQAWWLRDIQIKILDELARRNIPPLLAVIPIELDQDPVIVNYLKKNNCKFEIGLHGWDQGKASNYEKPEFADLSEEQAMEKITKGIAMLEPIKGSPLVTFIPPNNEYSDGTASALIKSGFEIVSAQGKGYFDWTASTYDFFHERQVSPEQAVADCQKGLDEKDLCVLMIHPQDFITRGEFDQIKYNNLLEILDELQKKDVMFVTPKDLVYMEELRPNYVKHLYFSPTLDQISGDAKTAPAVPAPAAPPAVQN